MARVEVCTVLSQAEEIGRHISCGLSRLHVARFENKTPAELSACRVEGEKQEMHILSTSCVATVL